MLKFNAIAKLTHRKYGTSSHAAARCTAKNSRMVQPTASHSATMSNSPASRFLAPKNNGAQRR